MNGKTKCTLMVVVVLVILVGIAVPAFIRARRQSQRNACLNNLHMIGAAIGSCAMAERWTDGDRVEIDKISQYMRGNTLPVCPSGGSYQIPLVGQRPLCSFHGDLLEELGEGRTEGWWMGMQMH